MSGYEILLCVVLVCSAVALYGCHRWLHVSREREQARIACASTQVSVQTLDPAGFEPAPDFQSLVRDERYRVVSRVPLTALLASSTPAALATLAHVHLYAVVIDTRGLPCAVIECQQPQGLAERKQAQRVRQLLRHAGIGVVALSPYVPVSTLQARINAVLGTVASSRICA